MVLNLMICSCSCGCQKLAAFIVCEIVNEYGNEYWISMEMNTELVWKWILNWYENAYWISMKMHTESFNVIL